MKIIIVLLLLLECIKIMSFHHSISNNIRKMNSMIRMSNTLGSYITVDLEVKNIDGKQLDSLFDQGRVSFVLNGGGFLPSIHEVAGKLNNVGDSIKEVIPSAGGIYNENMAFTVPVDNAPIGLQAGDTVQLMNGMKARCTKIENGIVTIDANPPLAGQPLEISMTLISKKDKNVLEQATIAGGCFWGMELAMQRIPGVVYTSVGYTQGKKENPTYELVCSGSTGHTEAVDLLFDPTFVAFETILDTFFSRHDPTQLNRQGKIIILLLLLLLLIITLYR